MNRNVGLAIVGAVCFLAGSATVWAMTQVEADEAWIGYVNGGVFAGAGVGMLGVWTRMLRRDTTQRRLRDRYPEQRWMWREDWAERRVRGGSGTRAAFSWALALLWNAGVVPSIWFIWDDVVAQGLGTTIFVLVFPFAGLCLLIAAIVVSIGFCKQRFSVLVLDTLPGVVGGRLRGSVETTLREAPTEGVSLALSCERRLRTRNRSSTTLLWRCEKLIPAAKLGRGRRGVSVPVDFTVPYACKPTTAINLEDGGVAWVLAADAAAAGFGLSLTFDAPVFRTAESSKDITEEVAAELAKTETETAADFNPARATFEIRPSPLGGTEIYFPPVHQPRVTAALITLSVVFFGAGAALFWAGAIVVPMFLTLVAVLAVLAALDRRLGVCLLRIEGGRVIVSQGMIGTRRTHSEAVSVVRGVKPSEPFHQPGNLLQAAGTFYYVHIELPGERVMFVGRRINSLAEALWLADAIGRLIDEESP